jgi:WD40 repeat protein
LKNKIDKKDETLFVGTCESKVFMWNATGNQGQKVEIGAHESAVKCVKWSNTTQSLFTGSWDKTIKIWDTKSNKCIESFKFNDKVVCMDIKNDYLVVGTADKQITTFSLTKGISKPLFIEKSPLNMQTRCISIFKDEEGYIAGSIEGKCAVQYFEQKEKNYCFKCHREGNSIFPVNIIDFHPSNILVTGGGGKISFKV